MNLRPFIWLVTIQVFGVLSCARDVEKKTLIPFIDGDWWQIAGDPDLGAFTSVEQQPVDFGVWRAADRYLISTLPVAAPEIIEYRGEYYIAALLPSLKGIRMAKLRWVSGK